MIHSWRGERRATVLESAKAEGRRKRGFGFAQWLGGGYGRAGWAEGARRARCLLAGTGRHEAKRWMKRRSRRCADRAKKRRAAWLWGALF